MKQIEKNHLSFSFCGYKFHVNKKKTIHSDFIIPRQFSSDSSFENENK